MNQTNPMPCGCRLDERGTYLHICDAHEAEFRRERDAELADEYREEMRRNSREQHEYDEWRQDSDRDKAAAINHETRGYR